MTTEKTLQGQWTSSLGFILAAASAAVGLGSIWKFPYMAGANGGGAFVLVYLLCVVLLGLPLLVAETMIGRRGRQNPADAMRTVAVESHRSRHWVNIGRLTILAGFLILSYYTVITGWVLDYVYQALMGHFEQQSADEISQLFSSLMTSPGKLIFWHSCVMIATVSVIVFGIEHGIERSSKFMLPAMLVLILIIVLYALDSGSFGIGATFLFKPDFSQLSADGFLLALGHAFFTLSIATGSIMMYGAYLPRPISIPKACLIVAITDTAISLFAGLAIFPIVFAYQLEPSAGPSLIFKTLPIAFGRMPYGQFIGVIFFIMLFFAAFASAISLLEPATAWCMEKLKLTRRKAAILMGSIAWLLGLPVVFSMNYFVVLDYLTANIMLPIGGLGIALFTAYQFNKAYMIDELNFHNGVFSFSLKLCLGVIAPLSITLMFLRALGVI